MSKTDNTRPYWVQDVDPTKSGSVSHSCARDQTSRRRGHHARGRRVWLRDAHGEEFTATKRHGPWHRLIHQLEQEHGCAVEVVSVDTGRHRSYRSFSPDCDYRPHEWFHGRAEFNQRRCGRRVHRQGGQRHLGGAQQLEQKHRRRRLRQRERAQLWLATRLGVDADFDLPPRREDRRTIIFDLT